MKDDLKEFNEWIKREETGINRELFQKRFSFQRPSDMLKVLYTANDKSKNNKLVSMIKSGLDDLKSEIGDMSIEEKEIEEPRKLVDIVERVREFNDVNQRGQGLKMVTPNQTLSRLPITLAQLKQEIIQKNLKTKSSNYCTLCTDKKTTTKKSLII